MGTRVQVVAPATAPARTNYRFWMTASVVHLTMITLLLAGTLLVPYLVGDPPGTLGGMFSLLLVLVLLVPYVWFTAIAVRARATIPRGPNRLVGGMPLRLLRRINIVGFVFDAALLFVAGLYVSGTPLPRVAFIAVLSLLVVLAFALPPAVFVAKIHLTRIGQALTGRLEELRRLRNELRRQHDPTRRA